MLRQSRIESYMAIKFLKYNSLDNNWSLILQYYSIPFIYCTYVGYIPNIISTLSIISLMYLPFYSSLKDLYGLYSYKYNKL